MDKLTFQLCRISALRTDDCNTAAFYRDDHASKTVFVDQDRFFDCFIRQKHYRHRSLFTQHNQMRDQMTAEIADTGMYNLIDVGNQFYTGTLEHVAQPLCRYQLSLAVGAPMAIEAASAAPTARLSGFIPVFADISCSS